MKKRPARPKHRPMARELAVASISGNISWAMMMVRAKLEFRTAPPRAMAP